jgi:transketolase
MATKKTNTSKTKNWDSLWNEYSNLLKKWAQNLETLQKTSSDIQTKYNEVMLKAASESSEKTLKEFHKNWQKAMNDAAQEAFKQFDKNWQNVTSDSGIDQLKAYGQLMDSFAKTWQKMWQK